MAVKRLIALQHNLALDEAGAALLINGSGAAVYTTAVAIRPDPEAKYGLSYKASGTTPVVSIVIEHSDEAPAAEGVADANFAVADDVTAIESSLSTSTLHRKGFSPDACAFIRLKILGLSGNGANTSFSKLMLSIVSGR